MAEHSDHYTQSRSQFGENASKVLKGTIDSVEALMQGYMVLNRMPPFPPGTGGAATNTAEEYTSSEPHLVTDAIKALERLRDFTLKHYV